MPEKSRLTESRWDADDDTLPSELLGKIHFVTGRGLVEFDVRNLVSYFDHPCGCSGEEAGSRTKER